MQSGPVLTPARRSGAQLAPQALVIAICSDAADFERLRPEWNALRPRGQDQDPFLSCDWFSCWWRAFGSDRKLQLLTVRQHGRLRAVLPMMLERTWCHGVPLRRLTAIGNDHTPRFDLVRSDDGDHLHRAIWNHLIACRKDWDVLDLPRLSCDSITLDQFTSLAGAQKVQYSLWQRAPRSPWIHIQPSWEEYLGSLSAGFRKTFRRKLRRLGSLGRVGLETVTGRAALDQSLVEGLEIEAEGCRRAGRTAILSEAAVAGFYTELAEIMAERGQLRLHFLTLNDVRIAFDYSIIANRCLYSLKAGHSSAHARHSPGTLMLGLILRQAHEEGLVGLDLLGDSDEFKLHWTKSIRVHQWLHCYSDSILGRLFHLVRCRLLPTEAARG